MNSGEDWTEETYRRAEEAIGYSFRDRELLLDCFTHSTYANNCGGTSNERLEWLGDAVLALIVSERLYRMNASQEGALTNLRKQYVSRDALTPTAEALGLMRFLRHSGSGQNLGEKTPSSLLEAVIAGIYLDGGFLAAKQFLDEHFVFTPVADYKTALQEYVQERIQETPFYRTWGESGAFECEVSALGRCARGKGASKKEAETAAARALYAALTERS